VVVDHAKTARLRLSHRFTRYLYLQRIRRAMSKPFLARYPAEARPVRDTVSFLVFPFLATTTVVLEKPAVVDSWRARRPGGAL
jgi:hypothetical protein